MYNKKNYLSLSNPLKGRNQIFFYYYSFFWQLYIQLLLYRIERENVLVLEFFFVGLLQVNTSRDLIIEWWNKLHSVQE